MLKLLLNKTSSIAIGAMAIAAMAICDIILLGHPVSGSYYYNIASFGAAGDANVIRAGIGAFGGALFGFFSISAYSHLEIKLVYIDYKKANAMAVAFISMAFFNSIFHVGYFFLSGNTVDQSAFEKYTIYLFALSCVSGI